jgi:hypothetical protein
MHLINKRKRPVTEPYSGCIVSRTDPREIDVKQNTPEWLAARKQYVTASVVSNMVGHHYSAHEPMDPSMRGKLVKAYADSLVQPQDPPDSESQRRMDAGREMEGLIAKLLEDNLDIRLQEQAFFVRDVMVRIPEQVEPYLLMAGASPDRLIAESKGPKTAWMVGSLVEIKAPQHRPYAKIPPDHYADQMMWQMFCTQRKRCIFIACYRGENNSHTELARVESSAEYIEWLVFYAARLKWHVLHGVEVDYDVCDPPRFECVTVDFESGDVIRAEKDDR